MLSRKRLALFSPFCLQADARHRLPDAGVAPGDRRDVAPQQFGVADRGLRLRHHHLRRHHLLIGTVVVT